jgi:hypothetical protein
MTEQWTVHEDGYGILEHHPKHKDGVAMLCRCADRMEAEYTVAAHNAALAAAKTTCDQCSRKLEDGARYEDHGEQPQEWTAESVGEFHLLLNDYQREEIAKYHNDALAAQAYQHGLAHGETLKMLVDVLEELHDDIAEYARINHLGGFDNHAMKRARAAIAKANKEKHDQT